MKEVISAFPFYGGKAKMAYLICDMLDYEHTDIYIEPFGGGARTLLNKPRHKTEIYNDFSLGLSTFMRVLSNPNTGLELISRLYETEYSQEYFDWALSIRNLYEKTLVKENIRLFAKYLTSLKSKYNNECIDVLISAIRKRQNDITSELNILNSTLELNDVECNTLDNIASNYKTATTLYYKTYNECLEEYALLDVRTGKKLGYKFDNVSKQDYQEYLNELDKEVKQEYEKISYSEFKKAVKKESKKIKAEAKQQAENACCYECSQIDEMELAVATYITQVQSRDGAAKSWSECKFKINDNYYNYVNRLYDVMNRLEGVQIWQIDIMDVFKGFSQGNGLFGKLGEYLNQENVMMYLDPSYLQEKGHDKDNKKSDNLSKNVGKVYVRSSSQEEHRKFLEGIRDAKCRILLSNYDDPNNIYTDVLVTNNPDKTHWKRLEFETKTSISNNSENNSRTEVLWYNY